MYVEYQRGTGLGLLKTTTGADRPATQLASFNSGASPMPTPDNTRVLYFGYAQENLMSVPLGGGVPTLIETASSYAVEVSPDSRLVTLYQEPGRPASPQAVLKIGRVAGGEPELVLKEARFPSTAGAWVDATHVIAVRQAVPPPLRFQTGTSA